MPKKREPVREERLKEGIDQIKKFISFLYTTKRSDVFNQCLALINNSSIDNALKVEFTHYIVQIIRGDLWQLRKNNQYNALGLTLYFLRDLNIDPKVKNAILADFKKFHNELSAKQDEQRKSPKEPNLAEVGQDETRQGSSANKGESESAKKRNGKLGESKKNKVGKVGTNNLENSNTSVKNTNNSPAEKVEERAPEAVENLNVEPKKIISNRISQSENAETDEKSDPINATERQSKSKKVPQLKQEEIDAKTKELIKYGNFNSITDFLLNYGDKIPDSEKTRLITTLSLRTDADGLYLTARDLDQLHIGESIKQSAVDRLAKAMAKRRSKNDLGSMYYFLRDIRKVKHEEIISIVERMVKIYGDADALLEYLRKAYKQQGKLAGRVEEPLRALILMKNNQQQ